MPTELLSNLVDSFRGTFVLVPVLARSEPQFVLATQIVWIRGNGIFTMSSDQCLRGYEDEAKED